MANRQNPNELIGKVFTYLKVVRIRTPRIQPCNQLECLCKCGKIVYATASLLRRGRVKSCGCYALEDRKRRLTTHGQCKTPKWEIWNAAKTRARKQNVPFDLKIEDIPNTLKYVRC
jgi:hypothetical protein